MTFVAVFIRDWRRRESKRTRFGLTSATTCQEFIGEEQKTSCVKVVVMSGDTKVITTINDVRCNEDGLCV